MIKKRKWFGVLVATIVIGVSTSGIIYAQTTFSDIQNNWAQTQIQKWANQGLVKGYPDGTFRPNHPVTRAEFVTMVNHAFISNKTEDASNFKDVSPSQWYYHEVAIAKHQGYIKGFQDGTFRPDNDITNQEVAVILSKLFTADPKSLKPLTYKDTKQIADWAVNGVQEVSTYNVMNGYTDGYFRPDHDITRAETLVTLDNAIALLSFGQPTSTSTQLPLPIQIPVPLPLPIPGSGLIPTLPDPVKFPPLPIPQPPDAGQVLTNPVQTITDPIQQVTQPVTQQVTQAIQPVTQVTQDVTQSVTQQVTQVTQPTTQVTNTGTSVINTTSGVTGTVGTLLGK